MTSHDRMPYSATDRYGSQTSWEDRKDLDRRRRDAGRRARRARLVQRLQLAGRWLATPPGTPVRTASTTPAAPAVELVRDEWPWTDPAFVDLNAPITPTGPTMPTRPAGDANAGQAGRPARRRELPGGDR